MYNNFNKSIFSKFFDANAYAVLHWMGNVLGKIASSEILPAYINKPAFEYFPVKDTPPTNPKEGDAFWKSTNPAQNVNEGAIYVYHNKQWVLICNYSDFITFWVGVCQFYAWVVIYGRQYENIDSVNILWNKFLGGLGLITNENYSLEKRLELFYKYPSEFGKRGTRDIFYKTIFYNFIGSYAEPPTTKQTGVIDPEVEFSFDPTSLSFIWQGETKTISVESNAVWAFGEEAEIEDCDAYWNTVDQQMYISLGGVWYPFACNDGEYLRLIGHKKNEEFIWAQLTPKDFGWCLGWSSPLWSKTQTIFNLTKGWDQTFFPEGVVGDTPTNYPTTGTVVIKSLPKEDIISIDPTNKLFKDVTDVNVINLSGLNSGIGVDNTILSYLTDYDTCNKLFTIDKRQTYIFSFRFIPNTESVYLKFGINCYKFVSYKFEKVTDGLLGVDTGETADSFTLNTSAINLVVGQEYWVKCILFGTEDYVQNTGATLNFPQTRPLAFNATSGVTNVSPYITVMNATTNVDIWDVRFKPFDLGRSMGYLGQNNIIITYQNINSGLSEQEIRDFAFKNLLGYKNILILNQF